MKTKEEILKALNEEVELIPKQIEEANATLARIQEELGPMEKGDMRENAGLQNLREQQARANIRLLNLEHKREAFKDFKVGQDATYVQEGTYIVILDQQNKQQYRFLVVPRELGNSLKGALSVSTPVAKAFLGKEVGTVVSVPTIEGTIAYELKEVS